MSKINNTLLSWTPSDSVEGVNRLIGDRLSSDTEKNVENNVRN